MTAKPKLHRLHMAQWASAMLYSLAETGILTPLFHIFLQDISL